MAIKYQKLSELSEKARKILLKAKRGEKELEIDYQSAGQISNYLHNKDYLSEQERVIMEEADEYMRKQEDIHMHLCDTGQFPS
ncbi:MAG TPA: hypothetical protein P5096_01265 [Patescibacteria group bacterium]|nr:hypothetical protein [Patescibacteria group bacterium]